MGKSMKRKRADEELTEAAGYHKVKRQKQDKTSKPPSQDKKHPKHKKNKKKSEKEYFKEKQHASKLNSATIEGYSELQNPSVNVSKIHDNKQKKDSVSKETISTKSTVSVHENQNLQSSVDGSKYPNSERKKMGSCMKHKKKDKVHRHRAKKFKKKKKDREENPAETVHSTAPHVLPRKPAEVSSNWKQLQAVLQKDDKLKKKADGKVREWQRKHFDKKKKSASSRKEEQETKEQKTESHNDKSSTPEIWFDDVDDVLLETSKSKIPLATTLSGGSAREWDSRANPLVKTSPYEGLTKTVAMDCEMVGVGQDGVDNMLARVSIVNQHGHCLFDKYVAPTERVMDYRTQYSGIRPGDLDKGEPFKDIQKEVSDIIKNRILIGHAIRNDLQVLYLDHPRKMIRDTSRYKPFRKLVQGGTPSLKKLSVAVLGVAVQEGEHNSVQDAQATMRLYTMYRKQWEKEIKLRQRNTKSSRAE